MRSKVAVTLMSKIDEVLEFLAVEDKSHSIDEVSEALDIPYSICRSIADFLSKYDFIRIEGSRLEINPKLRDFVIASSDTSCARQDILPLTTVSSL